MARVIKSFVSNFLFCCHKPNVYESPPTRTITTFADLFMQDPIITDTTVVGEDDGGVAFFDAQDHEGYQGGDEGEEVAVHHQEPNAKIGHVAEVLHGGDAEVQELTISRVYLQKVFHSVKEDGDAEEGVTGEEDDGDVEKEGFCIAGDHLWEVVHGGEKNGDLEGEGICIASAAVHEGFYGGEEDGDAEEEGICIAAAKVHEIVHVGEENRGVEGERVTIAAFYAHEIVYGRKEDEEELTIVGDDIQKVDHGGQEDERPEGEGICIATADVHEGVCDGEEDWGEEVDGICIAAATIPVVVHGGEEEEDAEVKWISIADDDVSEIFHGGEEEEDATVEGISISTADVHEAVHGGGEDGDAEWNGMCIAAVGVHEVVHGGEEDKEAIGISTAAASVQVVVHGREEEESEVEGISIAGDDDHKGFHGGVVDMKAEVEGIFIVGDDAHEDFYGGEKDGEVEGKGFCMSGHGHEVFNGENEGDVESEGAYKALGGGNQLVDQVDAGGVVRVFHKREDFEVFVGGLDKRTTESDLRKVFCSVGQLVEVRLVTNSMTNESKGFAFLQFAAVEQAKRAVLELNNTVVNGRRCGVTANRGRGRFAPTNFRRDRGAFFDGWVPKSLPPHPPSPNHTFAGRGRGGFRGRVTPRNIQGDRQPLTNLYDGARGLPPPESFYDRRPPVPSYPKSAQGSYNIRHGLSYNGSRIGSGGGRCSESFGRGYLSRGSAQVDGRSYSLYTGRGYCGKGYYGSSSYY